VLRNAQRRAVIPGQDLTCYYAGWSSISPTQKKKRKRKNTAKKHNRKERKKENTLAVSTRHGGFDIGRRNFHNLRHFERRFLVLSSRERQRIAKISQSTLILVFDGRLRCIRCLPVDTTYRSSCDPRRTAGTQDKRRLKAPIDPMVDPVLTQKIL